MARFMTTPLSYVCAHVARTSRVEHFSRLKVTLYVSLAEDIVCCKRLQTFANV